jgi:hypothetical protein
MGNLDMPQMKAAGARAGSPEGFSEWQQTQILQYIQAPAQASGPRAGSCMTWPGVSAAQPLRCAITCCWPPAPPGPPACSCSPTARQEEDRHLVRLGRAGSSPAAHQAGERRGGARPAARPPAHRRRQLILWQLPPAPAHTAHTAGPSTQPPAAAPTSLSYQA